MADAQILAGTTATLEVTFYADGVPADDGAVTVTITRADGTAVVTAAATTSGGTGVYQYILAAQPEVAELTVTWTGSTQQATTIVEIVGGLLYTLAALRAVKVAGSLPFQDAVAFPNSLLLDRRVEVTDDFEARTGWSFVPKFTREHHSGDGTSTLIVRQYKPDQLLSVTVDGAAQALADFDLTPDGILTWQASTFPTTRPGNVIVEYTRGWTRPPPAISSAALARTAMLLLPSQAGSTVNSWTTPDGVTYSYSQAGQSLGAGGIRHFGVPDIDAVLNSPQYHARGGVFA